MLGEKLGAMTSTTNNKNLSAEDEFPKFETSAKGNGTIVGVEVKHMAPYWTQMRADGTLYRECPQIVARGPNRTIVESELRSRVSTAGLFLYCK